MRWRALLCAALLALPGAASAQYWATRDVCDVPAAQIFEERFAPLTKDALLQAGREMPNGVGRLWRVESPDGAVSHLWGTFHSNDRLALDLPQTVLDQIRAARVIALEFDYTFKSRRAIEITRNYTGWWRASRSNFVFTPEATGLQPRIIDWIKSRLVGIGWSREAADNLTYAGLASLITNDPCNDFAAGTVPNQDSYIQTLGVITGAQIIGLEPPNALIDYLNSDEETALAMLAVYGSYLNPEADAKDRATYFALYRQGHIGAMRVWDAQYINYILGESGADTLATSDAYLLTYRNRVWIEAARDALSQGGVFMAVGSFHLPGKTGLVALLRGENFTVTRIALPGEAK